MCGVAAGPVGLEAAGSAARAGRSDRHGGNDHLSRCEYFKAELVKRSLGPCQCTPKKPIMVGRMIYLTPGRALHSGFYHHWIAPAAFPPFLQIFLPRLPDLGIIVFVTSPSHHRSVGTAATTMSCPQFLADRKTKVWSFPATAEAGLTPVNLG